MQSTLFLNNAEVRIERQEDSDKVIFQLFDKEGYMAIAALSFASVKELAGALVHSLPVSEWAQYPRL